jgi:putative mRNA 3-end processing factor
MFPMHPCEWTIKNRFGLYVEPGRFYIDPDRAVSCAVVTHGHSDHARKGHDTVIATPETLAVMECRYGRNFCGKAIPLPLHEPMEIGSTCITFYPAGHILGSVQVQVEYRGGRLGVSGDYKDGGDDPTCADFEAVPCDVFLTEATFALPFFRFPDKRGEVERLLRSMRENALRPHIVGVYSLGKAQRVIVELRKAGFTRPIYAHRTIIDLNQVYTRFGLDLGEIRELSQYRESSGEWADLLLAPPGSVGMPLESLKTAPIVSGASGWYHVRNHALKRGVELPLVISDHCDWLGLQRSIRLTGAKEVWITHGRADALSRWAQQQGIRAMALDQVWENTGELS